MVREKIHAWECIGANKVVLEWIDKGVSFPMNGVIPPFHHKRAAVLP